MVRKEIGKIWLGRETTRGWSLKRVIWRMGLERTLEGATGSGDSTVQTKMNWGKIKGLSRTGSAKNITRYSLLSGGFYPQDFSDRSKQSWL